MGKAAKRQRTFGYKDTADGFSQGLCGAFEQCLVSMQQNKDYANYSFASAAGELGVNGVDFQVQILLVPKGKYIDETETISTKVA